MKATEKAYWAAYFDGEGCVMFPSSQPKGKKPSKTNGCLRVTFTNTHFKTLEEGMAAFGGNICQANVNGCTRRRPTFMWYMYGEEAEIFLETILPFVREKREQALLGIAMRNLPPEQRPPLRKRLKALKHLNSQSQYEAWKAAQCE